MQTQYVGKVFQPENHVLMLGCERGSGDYYQCPRPSERFVYKPMVLNDRLIEQGYRYLTKSEVKKFFKQ